MIGSTTQCNLVSRSIRSGICITACVCLLTFIAGCYPTNPDYIRQPVVVPSNQQNQGSTTPQTTNQAQPQRVNTTSNSELADWDARKFMKPGQGRQDTQQANRTNTTLQQNDPLYNNPAISQKTNLSQETVAAVDSSKNDNQDVFIHDPTSPYANEHGYVQIRRPAKTKTTQIDAQAMRDHTQITNVSSLPNADQALQNAQNQEETTNIYLNNQRTAINRVGNAAAPQTTDTQYQLQQPTVQPAQPYGNSGRPTVSNVQVQGIAESNPNQYQLAQNQQNQQSPAIQPVQPQQPTMIATSMNQQNTTPMITVQAPANMGMVGNASPQMQPTNLQQTAKVNPRLTNPNLTQVANNQTSVNPMVQPQNLTEKAVYQSPTNNQMTMGAMGTDLTATRIEQTISQLEYYIENNPADTKSKLALTLLYASQDKRGKVSQLLSTMPKQSASEMESLARTILLASQSEENPQLANEALNAINQLSQKIADKADLQIVNLNICDEVRGFGLYNPIPKAAIQTGMPQRVVVYFELENFKTKQNADGKYFTQLHADITLYDSAYRVVTQRRSDVTDTPTFNKRHDFFLRGHLDVPKLTPGKYEIVVSIEDKIAGKIAEPKRYRFEVSDNLNVGEGIIGSTSN